MLHMPYMLFWFRFRTVSQHCSRMTMGDGWMHGSSSNSDIDIFYICDTTIQMMTHGCIDHNWFSEFFWRKTNRNCRSNDEKGLLPNENQIICDNKMVKCTYFAVHRLRNYILPSWCVVGCQMKPSRAIKERFTFFSSSFELNAARRHSHQL